MGSLEGVENKGNEFLIEVIEHNTTISFYDDGSSDEDGSECHSYFRSMEKVLEFLVEDVKVGTVNVTILGDNHTDLWENIGVVRRESFVERVEIIPLFEGRATISYEEFEEKYL